MKTKITKTREELKNSVDNTIKRLNHQSSTIKNKIFNMDITQKMEILLRHRIRIVIIAVSIMALLSLVVMRNSLTYLLTALLVGVIAMVVDFIIEYWGIVKNKWTYPTMHLTFKRVPIEVPLGFFSCGILATFAFYFFSELQFAAGIATPTMLGASSTQIFLVITSLFFMHQYFKKKVQSMVFWILPLAVALYISFPAPWILVASIFPIYFDYYLEKRLVKSAHLSYDKYSKEVATNVAFSYFPTTLFIFGVVALILQLLSAYGIC